MSRLLTAFCLLLHAAALPLSAQQPAADSTGGPLRIAVANLDLIAAQSPAGKRLQEQIQEFQQAAQSELEAKRAEADDIRRRAAEGANSLSEEKLAEMQAEYEDATIALRRMQDDKNREGQNLQTDGLKAIEAELEPVFREISDERGFDLVLNHAPGVVIMAGPRVDITAEVISRLQAAAEAEGE